VLLGASAGTAVCPDPVRVVHDRHDAVAEAVLVPGGERRDGRPARCRRAEDASITMTRPVPAGRVEVLPSPEVVV
jgi:hypothetical protein